MTADPARAQAVFLAAAGLADPARASYLDSESAGDAPLRARVDALLRAHDQEDSLLDAPLVSLRGEETRTLPAGVGPNPTGDTSTHGPATDGDPGDALAFLAPPGRSDSLGRLGHYEVLEVLGRGGFGIVYRAFDAVLQRVVAVKVLAPAMAATSPARKRFLREARSSARVRHENVVQVYEVGEQPLPYLVMEFVPGETLQQRLDRTGPLDVPEVLRIGRQVAAGLAAAHAQGLIHRDIKPSNILIDGGPQPQAKITDFGLARAADDASLTRSGVVAGTPMYMAPEQARGEPLNHRADLFSLGSVLYAMLTGRPPFRASNTPAVLKRVAEDTPRPIRELIPEVPDWLCRVVGKLHAKDPAGRFQTAKEVADLLADCEQQVKAHGALKDFSCIPGGKPARRLGWVARWGAAAGLVVFLFLVVHAAMFGGASVRYAAGRSTVEFVGLGDPDVEKLLVRRDGELVATLDRANRRADLAPGEYEVEAVCIAGYEATKFNVETAGLWRWSGSFRRVEDRPVIRLEVHRGDATTVGATAERRSDGQVFGEWGTSVDPNRVCQIIADGDGLAITVPEGDHDLNSQPGFNVSAPRVLRPVQGDFQVEVRVDAFPPPAGERGPLPRGYRGAGMVLWQDPTTFVRFWRAAERPGGRIYIHYEYHRNGRQADSRIAHMPNVPAVLRVSRSGAAFRFAYSTVAGKWVETPFGSSIKLDDRLEVGVAVVNVAAVPFAARFSSYRLQRAGDAASGGFVPLFNGKDLTGWKTLADLPGNWQVQGGEIVGQRTFGYLFSEREYQDFHLRAEVRLNAGGDSGIYIRCPFRPERAKTQWVATGYEAQIVHRDDDSTETGALALMADSEEWKVVAPAKGPGPGPDQWVTLEVLAQGDRVEVKVNGTTTAVYTDPASTFRRGHVALQVVKRETVVRFRKIEIKELQAD